MPPPSRVLGTSRLLAFSTGSPVSSSADFTCATVHVGWRSLSSAAAPATCGDAMLVPLSRPNVPSLFGSDDSTDTPGAVTSGFICSDTGVGPPEEKPAIVLCESAAATVMALGASPGTRPSRAEVGEVVAGGDDRDDARGRGAFDRGHEQVALRLDLGLAERHVDHVHPVRDRCLDGGRELGAVPVQPEAGRRDRQRLVVPDPGIRRDARDLARARPVPWSPAAMPATCVAWNDDVGSNGVFANLYEVLGANVRCTITFGVPPASVPSGSRAGTGTRSG